MILSELGLEVSGDGEGEGFIEEGDERLNDGERDGRGGAVPLSGGVVPIEVEGNALSGVKSSDGAR